MWFWFGAFLSSLALGAQTPSNQPPLYSFLGNPYDNGYQEERFDQVLDHFLEVFSPVVAEHGGSFHIARDWSDGAVNMWAERLGKEFWLEVPGGMARYHLITEEAFILSLCHELGHLLGGPPDNRGISFEGQSDYYASQTCMSQFLKNFPAQKPLSSDAEVFQVCQSDLLCFRILQGAKSLTSLYAELERCPAPQLFTPSSQVVSKTLTKHPPAQCRLDTFYAGFENRPRPSCWYKN